MKDEDDLPKFVVDNSCILCNYCVEQCPTVFELQSEGIKSNRQSMVVKQPEDDMEVEECMLAMHGCPVEAISIIE